MISTLPRSFGRPLLIFVQVYWLPTKTLVFVLFVLSPFDAL
jgi:hypothetical protein